MLVFYHLQIANAYEINESHPEYTIHASKLKCLDHPQINNHNKKEVSGGVYGVTTSFLGVRWNSLFIVWEQNIFPHISCAFFGYLRPDALYLILDA